MRKSSTWTEFIVQIPLSGRALGKAATGVREERNAIGKKKRANGMQENDQLIASVFLSIPSTLQLNRLGSNFAVAILILFYFIYIPTPQSPVNV